MSRLSDEFAAGLNQPEPAGLPGWARELRSKGAEAFASTGFPGPRDEAWKYTARRLKASGLGGIGRQDSATGAAVPQDEAADALTVRMINGRFEGMSGTAIEGLSVLPLAEALANEVAEDNEDDEACDLKVTLNRLGTNGPKHAFSALNNATLEHGVVIRVAQGIDAGRLVIDWAGSEEIDDLLYNSRLVMMLAPEARLEMLENFTSTAGGRAGINIVDQVDLAADASLLHARSVHDGLGDTLVTRTEIIQAAGSRYAHNGLDLGAGLARHDLRSQMQGEGAVCAMHGAYLPRGDAHVDIHLEIEHQARDCESHQFYRGVLLDRSRAIFNGRVHVHPGADGTEARQSNANLLLSSDAEVDTKPELEIEADEVVASHGATVGQLDEGAVFYLRSRGLSEDAARNLLTGAFCQAAIDKMPEGQVHQEFARQLDRVLGKSV